MKITNVEAIILRLPQIQARTDSSQDALLVKISTDAGITGWGEVDGCPEVAKAVIEAGYSHTQVNGLRAILLGEDPLATTRLWNKMYAETLYYGRSGAAVQAMAGVDIALWDIKGRALGKPVVELLGGALRDRMRVYSSNMFQFSVEATVERAKRAIDTGHTGVKFGWEPFGREEATGPSLCRGDPPRDRRRVRFHAGCRASPGTPRRRSAVPNCSSRTSCSGSRSRCTRTTTRATARYRAPARSTSPPASRR